jgi:pimeloyl-ACP methyl ester carboxylesterase
VVGEGELDLLWIPGFVSNVELAWEEPLLARYLNRLARFSRLILFDKRGTGLSDPVTALPTLEERMDDVRAVLDAVGSHRAVLLGVSEGGPMCSLFAATHPKQTEALIMIGTYARRLRAPDYPWAPTREQREVFCREIVEHWGGPVGVTERAPSAAQDPAFREWWASFLRMGASPSAAIALTRMNAEIDVTHVLPTIRVPTLVLHRSGDRCLFIEEGRYVASLIPERFLASARDGGATDRVLVTVLCSEVENGVPHADTTAPTELERLRALVVEQAPRFSGTAVRVFKGRVIVYFDGPARAIRCGCAIAAEAVKSRIRARLGLHTGESDIVDGIPQGVVVEIGSHVAALAHCGEILVTRTVVDLVAGSGLRFTDRGTHALAKGHKGWRVYAVREH